MDSWLCFDNRYDWLDKIKAAGICLYSKTNGRWYLPYDKIAYNAFLALDIPFLITGTQEDSTKVSDDKPVSQPDHPSIVTDTSDPSPPSPTGLESGDIHNDIKVSWTGKGFVIEMPYKPDNIQYVKQLEGAYWHGVKQKWVAKSTISNLEKIQASWQLWSKEEYDRWYTKVALSTNPCKIQLYQTPKHPGMACIKVMGHGANHQIIKSISGRSYDKQYKIYYLEADRKKIDQVLEGYSELGYQIDNRLTSYAKKSVSESKTKAMKVAHYVNKLPASYYSCMKRYTDAMMATSYSLSTITSYTGKICRILDHTQKKDIEQVSVNEINLYLQYCSTKGDSYSNLNIIHNAIRTYHKLVNHETWHDIDRLVRPKTPQKLPRLLSANEILRLFDVMENVKHIAIISILYGSGIRKGELLNIKIEDVYWDRKQIFIRHGKGAKDRVVNLSQVSKQVLELYFHEYKPTYYLFEGAEKGRKYTGSSISKFLHAAATKANISKKVTPHMLRHSFATHQMDAGIALPKIQALLGHKDIKTTMVYTHLSTNDITEVESPLDRVLKKKSRKP